MEESLNDIAREEESAGTVEEVIEEGEEQQEFFELTLEGPSLEDEPSLLPMSMDVDMIDPASGAPTPVDNELPVISNITEHVNDNVSVLKC